ncbi:hypothetical protein ACFOUP_18215 [Belliella kenyensis]|uniref:DUF5648 domain-containing protein n=1 Tax=Belliella kenyensis TaxID=1472724 RepID=A0ABV8ESZ5_9BACT|nr:hypothetical protein [Belliella kenyensis]MCH7402282.1 hypothetical protein [Belliella kenyensis]MDN3601799.1 hypothetical protein [Belliella kenyensis]
MVHEIGHIIGLHHTDWQTPTANPNNVLGVLINGTWNVDSQSIINHIYNGQPFNGLSGLDLLAIRTIYPLDNGERPLYTYYKNLSGNVKLHAWTGNWNDYGFYSNGFIYRGATGYFYNYQKSGTVPLYRFQNSLEYYYLSIDPNVHLNFPDFQNTGVIGYVYNSHSDNKLPVYEFWYSNEGHFISNNFNDAWISGPGWTGGRITFYVGK